MRRWIVLVLAAVLLACGGKGAAVGGEKKPDLDADPLALLPGSVVAVGSFEARAVADLGASGGAAGAELAGLAGKLLPFGEDAGFNASRDVDRVVLGSYAMGGADFVAVLTGRFDQAKIEAATRAADGAPIVRGAYADRTTYAAAGGPVQCAVLTPRTAAAGSVEALRRLLDRVKAGELERSIPPWMADTIETKGAQIAFAADFSTQPIAAAAIGAVNLDWLKSLRLARAVGNFEAPGMNVAATLTYADPPHAQAAVEGVRVVDGWLKVLGPVLGGMRLQNLQVDADGADLRCKFALDDQALRALLALSSR